MDLVTVENLENNKLTKYQNQAQNPNQCIVDYIQNDKSKRKKKKIFR